MRDNYSWEFETVKRTDLANSKIQYQRWKVERTIGWTMNWRSLCRHYERDSASSKVKVLWASVYYRQNA
ncbi:MAG: hypothetical protein LBT05_12165 [Planctomycetaceae bacterium]|nr:hypothetical protein [Planctomycetaceae bacterium]